MLHPSATSSSPAPAPSRGEKSVPERRKSPRLDSGHAWQAASCRKVARRVQFDIPSGQQPCRPTTTATTTPVSVSTATERSAALTAALPQPLCAQSSMRPPLKRSPRRRRAAAAPRAMSLALPSTAARQTRVRCPRRQPRGWMRSCSPPTRTRTTSATGPTCPVPSAAAGSTRRATPRRAESWPPSGACLSRTRSARSARTTTTTSSRASASLCVVTGVYAGRASSG